MSKEIVQSSEKVKINKILEIVIKEQSCTGAITGTMAHALGQV